MAVSRLCGQLMAPTENCQHCNEVMSKIWPTSHGLMFKAGSIMGCLHDPANVQQTSSKCIQNTRANAGRLLDRVNILYDT